MARPTIALLTDFGTADHYVAAMKGVALGICPDATLVDVTHEIPPQDVLSASLQLAACLPYFPGGTVFLAVVDPGVGTSRRGMALECGAWRVVSPDNGLVTHVLARGEPWRAVSLELPGYRREVVSRTFEGRDRFAPAAAWLARGTRLDALGPAITDPVRLPLARPVAADDGVAGEVVLVDRFGNLVTNIDAAVIASLDGPLVVTIEGRPVGDLVSTYAERPAGALCALVGSSGWLEIACSRGSAAAVLGAGRGAAVRIARGGRPPAV